MINVTPLSQRYPVWSSIKINGTQYTLGTSGCTITCVAMLANYVLKSNFTPTDIETRLRLNNGFVGAKVLWSAINKALPGLKFVYRDYNYQNPKVAYYIYIKGLPVLVEVNPNSKLPGLRHWVLALGNQKIADPWDGQIKSIYTYPLTGDSLISRS